jgi:hypothetical protein
VVAQTELLRDLGCCQVEDFASCQALPDADVIAILRRKTDFTLGQTRFPRTAGPSYLGNLG